MGNARMTGRTWVESSADHSWHNNEEHREDFEVATEYRTTFGMGQVFGRQRPLHYHLQT